MIYNIRSNSKFTLFMGMLKHHSESVTLRSYELHKNNNKKSPCELSKVIKLVFISKTHIKFIFFKSFFLKKHIFFKRRTGACERIKCENYCRSFFLELAESLKIISIIMFNITVIIIFFINNIFIFMMR